MLRFAARSFHHAKAERWTKLRASSAANSNHDFDCRCSAFRRVPQKTGEPGYAWGECPNYVRSPGRLDCHAVESTSRFPRSTSPGERARRVGATYGQEIIRN